MRQQNDVETSSLLQKKAINHRSHMKPWASLGLFSLKRYSRLSRKKKISFIFTDMTGIPKESSSRELLNATTASSLSQTVKKLFKF